MSWPIRPPSTFALPPPVAELRRTVVRPPFTHPFATAHQPRADMDERKVVEVSHKDAGMQVEAFLTFAP